jgi:FkbM family methyltransferase
MNFNQSAIEAFGQHHKEMNPDAPNKSFDEAMARLTTYLDLEVVRRWALPLLPSNPTILDIGAGKGRMSRLFATFCNKCVAIEPFVPFYHELLRYSLNIKNIEAYNCTLSEFARTDRERFHFVYASGVTPYLDDSELHDFFGDLRRIIRQNGVLCIRSLDDERERTVAETEIYRIPKDFMELAYRSGFRCLRFRRAYPPFVARRIYEMWPSTFTKALWDTSSMSVFYPFWHAVAEMNLPRIKKRSFFVYLLEPCS